MQNTLSSEISWYKQFWPWFLIFLPTAAVAASIATLVLAIQNQDSLVVDDYYKEAMQINRNLSKVEYAKKMGILADLSINDGTLLLHLSAQDNSLNLAPVLNVFFNHSTQASKDFSSRLIQETELTENNKVMLVYSSEINEAANKLKKGSWYVRLEPIDQAWQLKGKITGEISDIKLLAK